MGVDFRLTGVPNFDKLEVVKNSVAEVIVPVGYSEGVFYSTVVPHNLGYIPGIICYCTPPSNYPADPSETPVLLTLGGPPFAVSAIADTNVGEINTTFSVYGVAGILQGTWRFNYFLLRSVGAPTSV